MEAIERRITIYMKSNLKDLRMKRCFTQKELADAVGVSKRTIYAIEQENQDIHISLAYKLADILDCSVEELYMGVGAVKPFIDKAIWFARAALEIAIEIEQDPKDVLRLLERTGLAERTLSAYPMLHTQGYEYVAEVTADLLREEGVLT
jgi:putative transcriptional regulator